MNLKQTIRKVLREDKKTKSTNKEFSKYKNSKFNSLRDYTLQDIVDNWDSLSDHKNENIKTIKYFVDNPDKITDLVYDEKGLEDGYHRLIAAKILKKPRFSYKLVENLQERIRKVLREETNPTMRRILRRTDSDKMEKIFIDGLDTMTQRYIQNIHNWHAMNFDKFKQGIVSYLIVDVCIKYVDVCYGNGDFYNQVWDFLSDHYSDRIEEKWEEINSGEIN